MLGKSVRKLLENGSFEEIPDIKETPEVVELQGLNLVAGTGFEPVTFGL